MRTDAETSWNNPTAGTGGAYSDMIGELTHLKAFPFRCHRVFPAVRTPCDLALPHQFATDLPSFRK